jgi:hypothetical protein
MSVEISLLLYSISLKLRNFWGKQREINRGDLASASKAGHKQTTDNICAEPDPW